MKKVVVIIIIVDTPLYICIVTCKRLNPTLFKYCSRFQINNFD
jgi:hypothetical protein